VHLSRVRRAAGNDYWPDGNPFAGRKHTQETRDRIAVARKECWRNPAYRARMLEILRATRGRHYRGEYDAEIRTRDWDVIREADRRPAKVEGNGYFYAAQLDPGSLRVKFGFSANPARRVQAFRTTDPLAVLLKVWRSHHSWEIDAIALAAGLVGNSRVVSAGRRARRCEVVNVADVGKTLRALDGYFGQKLNPADS
jgi:hypothetical protein